MTKTDYRSVGDYIAAQPVSATRSVLTRMHKELERLYRYISRPRDRQRRLLCQSYDRLGSGAVPCDEISGHSGYGTCR